MHFEDNILENCILLIRIYANVYSAIVLKIYYFGIIVFERVMGSSKIFGYTVITLTIYCDMKFLLLPIP